MIKTVQRGKGPPEQENPKNLSQDPVKLRRRRLAAGLSLTDAARRAGCSKAHVSMLEKGEHGASPQLLARFASLYGCEVADLMPDE
ncbi:MAG TPA: helix-turn-helix transcriptional regulator [Streptosporangiaceae bacterium]|nr:helix-turn-helix transcriptional regulator [Streptosporangiaceae bacterium]